METLASHSVLILLRLLLVILYGVAFRSRPHDGGGLHDDLQHDEDARPFSVSKGNDRLFVRSDEDLKWDK